MKCDFRNNLVQAVLLFLAILIAGNATAVEITGRLFSDLYAYESRDTGHLRPYLGARANLTLLRDQNYRSLSFRTYFRWRSDFSNKLTDDPQTFIYDSYLKLTGYPGRTDIRLGRQFVFNSTGSVLLDGLRVKYIISRKLKFDFFGGSSVSSEDPEKIQSLSDHLSLGGKISYNSSMDGRYGLNWMLRKRDGSVYYNRVGLDSWRKLGNFEYYGRFSYNFVGFRVGEIMSRLNWTFNAWLISGEFQWREPSVPGNSIFSLIDFNRYKETRFNIQRKIWRGISAVGQVHVTFFENDNAWRMGFGFRSSMYSIMWNHQQGYAGDRDGLSGFLNLRLHPKLNFLASANLYRYRIQIEQEDKSDAYTGSAGFAWRPGYNLSARIEGQYLRNAVQSEDYRLLIKLAKDFSVK